MFTPDPGERLAEPRGDTGVATHARTDQRHLADVIVVKHPGEADLILQRGELLHRAGPTVARAREGDVGLAVLDLGDVLQHHVDVHVGVGDGAEHLRRVAGDVGQADDRHLGLAAIVCDSGQNGVFHAYVLYRSGHKRAGFVRVRRPDMNRNIVAAGVFHTAKHQHLGPARRQLEHLLERDGVQPLGVGHDARVGGEDAVDVGVDLADIGLQRGGQRDGGGVRPAAAERRDVLAVLADPLEAGDQDDQPPVERLPQPARRDVDDLGVAVGACGDHAGLRPGEGPGLGAQRLDGHRDQRVGNALPRGQQHVHLPRRRGRADLSGQVEQVIGGVAHR